MRIEFVTSNPVPVDTDDPMERAARRLWCETSIYRKPGDPLNERYLTEDWNDACDRDNAMSELRTALACLEAEGVVTVNPLVEDAE